MYVSGRQREKERGRQKESGDWGKRRGRHWDREGICVKKEVEKIVGGLKQINCQSCVCVWERERETDRQRDRERKCLRKVSERTREK